MLPRVDEKTMKVILTISLIAASLVAALPFITNVIPSVIIILDRDLIMITAVGIGMFPLGVAHLLNLMWRRGIDRNIPKVLRGVYESGRIGVSIPQALKMASEQDLGPLTKELKRMVNQMSWGRTIEEATEDLIKRTGTPLSRRTFSLILEAYKTGGDIEEMMSALYKHISEMQITLQGRRAMMRPYITYVYMTFFVFLAIDVILLKSFFVPILSLQETFGELGGQIFRFGIDLASTSRLFFHMTIIQASIGGLVAGKMGEGSTVAGLKHVVVLLLACVLTFYLFIWR